MIVLAELTPLDPVTGTRETLRASSANHRKVTGLNDQIWHPAISSPPAIGIRLFKGDFDGTAAPNGGTMSIQIDRFVRHHANARRLIWQGAKVKLWAGVIGQAWPWAQVYEGLVDGDNFAADGNRVQLSIKSDTSPFDKDALTLKYLGTGGAEGGDSLKGQPKPFLLGRCKNVEPVLIDADYNIYQFSGYGPIHAVNALYERGSDFGVATADYANYAALVAATIPNGGWATCLAAGLVRLAAPQYGVITGDVDGDKYGGTWRRKTGEIVQRIASNAGVSGVDAASWNALDAALAGLPNQGRIGYFLGSQKSVLECAAELAAPCNAQAGVSLMGKLFAARIVIGAGSLTLDAQQRQLPRVVSSDEAGVSAPYSYMQFGYDRAWRVHSADEIAFVSPSNFNPRGPYDGAETYAVGDSVVWLTADGGDGRGYIRIGSGATTGTNPSDGTKWAVFVDKGEDGISGLSNAVVFAFKRAATTPAGPSATATYTFATGALTGLNNGWAASVPTTDGNPLWVIAATASSTGASDAIAAGEWSGAVIQAQDGAGGTGSDGLNNASVFLYQRNGTGTPPAVPAATLTYTFVTAALSGGSLAGWSQSIPSSAGGAFLFVTTATALSTTATDTIATGEWATVRIMAQDGADGTDGSDGANGVDGVDGADGKLVEFVWKRAATIPATPTGNGIPATWNDDPPSGSDPLWMSKSKQELDGTLIGVWSTPIRHDGPPGSPGTDGDDGTDGISPVLATASPASKQFSAEANGTVKTGQLPFDVAVTGTKSGAAISGSVSILGVSGCTATATSGGFTIDTVTADDGYINWRFTASDGQIVEGKATFSRQRDPTGGGQVLVNFNSTAWWGSGSYAASGPSTVLAASSTGKLKLTGYASFYSATNGSATMTGKLQYRAVGSGTWIDAGISGTGVATRTIGVPGEPNDNTPGVISASGTVTSLTANGSYEMQMVGNRSTSGKAISSATGFVAMAQEP